MIDVSKAKWTLSEETVFAVEWFEKNGFSGSLDKQYISKTKFTVSKNGVTDKFELPSDVTDIVAYMERYRFDFERLCEPVKLRAQVAAQGTN